jgi:hypothetical protein
MRRIITLVTVLGALLAFPAAGHAKYTVGISEQQSSMFSDPLFQQLNVKVVRLIVPWDYADKAGEISAVNDWLGRANAQKKRVLVSFGASRSRPTKLPSVAVYKNRVRAFASAHPYVREYNAWNEANHLSQPTWKSPKRAAQYYKALKSVCKKCTHIAADLLDQKTVKRGSKKYLSAPDYAKQFNRFAGRGTKIWGLHNYADANRFRTTGISGLARAVKGSIWLTETGGLVKLGDSCGTRTKAGTGCPWPYSTSRAKKATSYLFKIAKRNSRIKRIYLYEWSSAESAARFDAGLLGPDGKPRPAYSVLKKELSRR